MCLICPKFWFSEPVMCYQIKFYDVALGEEPVVEMLAQSTCLRVALSSALVKLYKTGFQVTLIYHPSSFFLDLPHASTFFLKILHLWICPTFMTLKKKKTMHEVAHNNLWNVFRIINDARQRSHSCLPDYNYILFCQVFWSCFYPTFFTLVRLKAWTEFSPYSIDDLQFACWKLKS